MAYPLSMRPGKPLVLAAVLVAVLGSGQSSLGRRRAVLHPAPAPPAPVASADSYTVNTPPLTIAAPGVLANDTLNGATITSFGASTGKEQPAAGTATSTAKGGTVTLNADGSFTYTPAGGFSGSDTFVYVLKNAGGESPATVTLTVVSQQPQAIEIQVTSPGFFFSFGGIAGENPALTLKRGQTYKFIVDTSDIHPFEIVDAPQGSVTNNNISFGVTTFVVPNTTQNYRYICSIHGFGNKITSAP